MRASVTGLGVLVVLLLVGVSSLAGDVRIALGAVGAAAMITLLVALGPERLGLTFLLLATLLAPLNRLRISDSGNITFADLVYLAGFGLLLPRLLTTSKRLPKLYTIGVTVLVLNALVVSLLSPAPILSLIGFAKVAFAIIMLPILLARLDLDRAMFIRLAWAFVLGQIGSLGWSLTHNTGDLTGGRAIGYTTHPNFFGLSGQMAVCLCIFLFYEVDRRYRWVVVGAGGLSIMSVLASGSRASLLCVVVTIILWPLVERTAMSMYVVVTGAALVVASANAILANAPEGSALARLQGEGSATGSNLAREAALQDGFDRFWAEPLRGNGFNDILQIHNVYLEVAVGGGILALVGFLFVLAGVITPLFRPGVPNRLSYMGVSYAAFALIGPTLYDRVLWGALALAIAGHDFGADRPPADSSDSSPDDSTVSRNDDVSPRQRPRQRRPA